MPSNGWNWIVTGLLLTAMCSTASAQSWKESEEAARDAITTFEEQVSLGEEYVEIARHRSESAVEDDNAAAQAYRKASDRMLSLDATLDGLKAEIGRTEDSRKRMRLEQRFSTARLAFYNTLEEMTAAGDVRKKTIDARAEAKRRLEDGESLSAQTRQKLSELKLEMAEHFARNAAPILEEVDVLNSRGETIYHGFWGPKEDELLGRIAFANAVIKDYQDKIDAHAKRVQEWIDLGVQQMHVHKATEDAYQEFFQSVDEDSLLPAEIQLHNYGVGTWETMGVDASYRLASIFNNRKNFGGSVPVGLVAGRSVPAGAIIYEGAWAAYDGYAWYNGEVRNPTWDVLFDTGDTEASWMNAAITGADKAAESIIALPNAHKVYKNKPLSKATKGALQALYRHFKADDAVKIAELRRMIVAGELAASFSENMVHGSSPSALFADARRAVGSKAFTDYWKSPEAISKSIKQKLFSNSAYYSYFRSLVLSGLKGAALGGVEQQRLKLLADADSAYDHSRWLKHRVVAEVLFKYQAMEHRAALMEERDNLQRLLLKQKGDRFVLGKSPNGVLGGRETFELWLTFSRPVITTKVTISGKDVKLNQDASGGHASKVWKGEFDLEDLDGLSQLKVDAIDDVSQKQLADPRKPPRWDPDNGEFEQHRMGTDGHHWIRVIPIEGGRATAIVFDSSGSMADDGKIIAAKRAMTKLLRKMNPRRGDVFGVFTFDGCWVREAQPIDGSDNKAREAIAAIEPEGDTPLGAAIRHATDALLNETSKSELSLIVVTDGEDSCGGLWQKELERANSLLSEATLKVIQ